MDKISTTIVVLAATWAAIFNVIKLFEIMNSKRDLILNIHENGQRLTAAQKLLLLTHDYIPMWIGATLFLAIFTGGLASIPFTKGNVALLETIGCIGAAAFTAFVLATCAIGGFLELTKMREHIGAIGHKGPDIPASYCVDRSGEADET